MPVVPKQSNHGQLPNQQLRFLPQIPLIDIKSIRPVSRGTVECSDLSNSRQNGNPSLQQLSELPVLRRQKAFRFSRKQVVVVSPTVSDARSPTLSPGGVGEALLNMFHSVCQSSTDSPTTPQPHQVSPTYSPPHPSPIARGNEQPVDTAVSDTCLWLATLRRQQQTLQGESDSRQYGGPQTFPRANDRSTAGNIAGVNSMMRRRISRPVVPAPILSPIVRP